MFADTSGRFRRFVDDSPTAMPIMPVMHSCYGKRLVDIMDSGRIVPGPLDEDIGKHAVFLFYGKPSYRPKSDGSYHNGIWSALFTFVLDLSKLPRPSSALPFDSGGFG